MFWRLATRAGHSEYITHGEQSYRARGLFQGLYRWKHTHTYYHRLRYLLHRLQQLNQILYLRLV
jgi:hypothetical protein